MKRILLIVLCLLIFPWTPCQSAEPIQLARMNPWVAGAGTAISCGASLFEDNFGTNDFSKWTSETDSASLLTATTGASVLTHTATTIAYTLKTLASSVAESWIQYDVTLSDTAMGGNAAFLMDLKVMTADATTGFYINYVNNSGGTVTTLLLGYKNDAYVNTTGLSYAWSPTNGQKYTIKIHSIRSTDVDTNDGVLELWVDGSLKGSATNLDWYTYADIRSVILGNIYSGWTDTSGKTVTHDNFEWRSDDCF